jgi:hypothetical protein
LKRLDHHTVLYLGLHALYDESGPIALALEFGQLSHRDGPGLERACQDVCSDDSILDGIVDSYVSHGRHYICGITDYYGLTARSIAENATPGDQKFAG